MTERRAVGRGEGAWRAIATAWDLIFALRFGELTEESR